MCLAGIHAWTQLCVGKRPVQFMLACMPVQRSTCPDKRLRPELMYETGAVTVLHTALPHDDVCNKHKAFCGKTVLTILQFALHDSTQLKMPHSHSRQRQIVQLMP